MLDFYDVDSLLMAFDINMLFFFVQNSARKKIIAKKPSNMYWEILENISQK